MEITKKKFCISKKSLFLLGILFSIAILTIIVFYTKKSISLFSKASENNAWKICAINIKTMKNTNNCCNNDELNKGYRCYRDYYSINCNTKDVVKCGRDNCNNETGLCKGEKNIPSPKTKGATKSDTFKKRIVSPTSTPKPIPTAKPTQIISSPLNEFQKFMKDNGIADMDNRVLVKQYSQAINEILSLDLQNQLHSMLSTYFANPLLKDYVFKVTNDEIKYTENWNISGTTGTTYYAYYYKNCPNSLKVCFDPNDNKCLKSSGNCDYYVLLDVTVKKDYKYNNNALYEWSIGGLKLPPDEDKYPWVFGIDKNDNIYTMASTSFVSSVMVEEATKLGNNKVFIGYSTRAGYLLIEIYRENSKIVLRGILMKFPS